MEKTKKISVVIPCYNEEKVLDQLFDRVTKSASLWKHSWEVICVDDGSKDATWDKLKAQSKKDPRWKTISFSRNFGQQMAISCGLNYVSGDAIIIMDADLQDPPEELHRYISKWEEGYDVVYAIRTKRKEEVVRKLGYWAFYRIFPKLVNFYIPLDAGDFSVMDKKVVEVLKNMPERNRFVRVLRAWTGFKQIGLECERGKRVAGKTSYSLRKLLGLGFNGILSFSSTPLTVALYFGLFVTSLALILAVLGFVPSYSITLVSVLFLGGIQLVFLGVIGSYLSRIYDEVRGRPHWIIKDSTITPSLS